ncbi:hypothetical protein Tco_0578869 [Tanacetum coccineum]
MELESTNSGPTAKLPILKLGEYEMWAIRIRMRMALTVTKKSTPATATERTNKKKMSKLIGLPRKLQKNSLDEQYKNFSTTSAKSLDSIFIRTSEVSVGLAILGVIITQEDLNLKFLSSLPPEWNTHIVVWMNKPEVETISIDDLYNNFKIVEQKVKKTVGTSSGGQNLAFMTAPSCSSTNDANTACLQVSAASPSVNTASPQVCTASVSDNIVYAFMVENPNGSNVLYQDLEKIHEDDLEAMDLKWQLSLLTMRAKNYYQRKGKKIFINGNDIAGYDKSKVKCYNCHKLGHFARSAVAQEAINGFDWSNMAEEQVQTNMALMAFSDSESEKLKKYKRCFGISVAVPPHHSVNYKLDLKARFVLFWSDEFKSLIQEQVSQDKSIFVEGYGYNTSKSVSEVEPNKVRKNDGAPIIEVLGVRLMMRKQMSLSLSLEEKTCLFPTVLIDRERQYMMIKDLFTVVGLKAILTGNIAYLSVFQAVGWRLLLHLEEVHWCLKLNAVGPSVSTASPNEEDNTKEEPKVDLGNITNSYIVPTTPNTRIHKDHPIDNVIGEVQSIIEPTAFLKLYLFHPGCIGGNKIVFAFASFMGFLVYQNDGKECFLYGTIEKKSMLLNPPGFKISDRPDKSYKVSRHFTGLHSAPRSMKKDGIFISQDKYVAEILKKFNYSDVKSASTPVDLEKPLVKDRDADDVDVHLYRSMIGSLMYLTASRPDIMFAVCACARFQVTPKTSHLLAVKRIFRYLKGKPTLGLWYSRDSPFKLVAYTDSDYAGATQDRKSTTRGISKEVGIPRYLSLVVPLTKVGDEAVHKELGDRMERVATTASSLEAEQDNVTFLEKPEESDGFAKIIDFLKASSIHYALIVNPIIYTSCIEQFWATAKVQTVNGVRQLQALVDKKRVIVTESSIRKDLHLDDAEGINCLPTATIFEELARMGYEKPSQKLTFYKAFFSPHWKYFIHTITQCLSAKSNAWNEFSSSMASLIICLATNQKFNLSKYIFDAMVKHLDGGVKFLMYPCFLQVFINQQLRDMSTHKKIFVNPFHTKKVFANMKRAGKDFSGRITPLFDTMMVQVSKEVGEDSDHPTDSTQIPINDQPSSSSQPKKKQPSQKAQRQEPEVPQDETEHEESIHIPSNDLQPSSEDSMQLTNLMVLCTKLQTWVLDLEKAKDAQAKEIAALKKRIQRLERKKMSRPTGLKRLRKVDIDADVEVTLVNETQERQDDELMFDTGVLEDDEMLVEAKVNEKDEQITKNDDSTAGEAVPTANVEDSVAPTTIEEITLAQTLIQIKAAKPKVVTTAATTTTTTRPKARGVVVKEPSEKDQIALEEQVARDIQAKLDAELIEEQRLAKKQEEEANIALIESWENKQAMMEVDRLLAERLQSRERPELTDEEKAKLFMELMEKRRKYFATLHSTSKEETDSYKGTKENSMSTS